MTYELALKLKEAGFPPPNEMKGFQSWCVDKMGRAFFRKSERYPDGHICQFIPGQMYDAINYIYIPTLSELIEACGEDFVLQRDKDKIFDYEWIAGTGINADGEIQERCYGETNEVAVANLYLALHNK